MNKKGFTIIEIITAIFVLIVGIGAVSGLITYILSSISIVENKMIAAYLAQEGIELVRNIRDNNLIAGNDVFSGLDENSYEASYNLDSLATFTNGKIYFSSSTGYTNNSSTQETKFTRKITINGTGQTREVRVDITFEERGRIHNFPPVVEILTSQK